MAAGIVAAAAGAAFNAILTRLGFAGDAIASINQTQVTSTASLIGMEKDDVEHYEYCPWRTGRTDDCCAIHGTEEVYHILLLGKLQEPPR
jgi:hypothetical protein